MGTPEIEAFLTHLAVDQKVAASTQNQALNAILFLYREVLKQDLEGRINAIRAKRPKRLPTVLTREEVRRVLDAMSGTPPSSSPDLSLRFGQFGAPTRRRY
jgi:site-specific recombinase XerD